MSRWTSVSVLALASWLGTAQAQTTYPGIGRTATASEIAAWNIDVRPDFQGLPAGAGSVAQGQEVWESRCASCHGIFGESNEVFSPLVGGTTADDVKRGRVARLTDASFPGRTTLMKAPHVATLWDYIRRAMPWNAPKSLSTQEVYAVTAYLLNLGGIVPDDFVLSDTTMPEAQRRLPNRNGFTTDHALWPGSSRAPDVKASACMTHCSGAPRVTSQLPDFARSNHGNLADQQRLVGPHLSAGRSRRRHNASLRPPASASRSCCGVMPAWPAMASPTPASGRPFGRSRHAMPSVAMCSATWSTRSAKAARAAGAAPPCPLRRWMSPPFTPFTPFTPWQPGWLPGPTNLDVCHDLRGASHDQSPPGVTAVRPSGLATWRQWRPAPFGTGLRHDRV